MLLILPPITKLLLARLLPVPVRPNHLPNALADNAHRLGPELPNLRIQDGRARNLLRLAQLRGILGRPAHEVRVAHAVQPRQVPVLLGLQTAVREAGAVQELPEEVGGVRVGVATGGGCDAWVEADEDADEVGFQDVR